MAGRDPIAGDAIVLIALAVDEQVVRIDLRRLLEQHAVAVPLAAGSGMQRPAGVLQREVELARVLSLLCEPPVDVRGERELVEPAAEARSELPFERRAVQRFGFGRFDARAGAPLDELALDRVERRELVVPLRKCEDLVGDAEELGEKALEVRREVEQQLRLGLCIQGFGIGAAGAQGAGEGGIRGFEEREEPLVQPGEAGALVEILEREAVGESQRQDGRPVR